MWPIRERICVSVLNLGDTFPPANKNAQLRSCERIRSVKYFAQDAQGASHSPVAEQGNYWNGSYVANDVCRQSQSEHKDNSATYTGNR